MGLFTSKMGNSPEYALIGELMPNGDMIWNTADIDYCIDLFDKGVLEDRGYKTVNSIFYRLFYLPPPKA